MSRVRNERSDEKRKTQRGHFELRPVESLQPDPSNPRLHSSEQIRAIAASIEAFGFNAPVLIDKVGRVVAGHGRLAAAKALGLSEIPTIRLDHLSETQARAYTLADNQLTERSTWDDDKVAAALQELSTIALDFALEATGFETAQIDLRIQSLQPPEASEADDPVKEPDGLSVSQIGDLWVLGPHRLLCGDAREQSVYEALMAQIFWGAGLQVMAAWYIATETTSELKKGGYVQGTVILIARKRRNDEAGYKDEIVQEVKAEVAEQIDTMSGLNQNLKGHGRAENLFEDADLQMAGYAAALRVLTKYEKIDGTDMTKEALRPRRAGEKNFVGEIIDFAVQVANEHMVPEHMTPKLWEGLSGAERFYFKMMDIETTSLRKLDNYQNFAKAFRVSDYGSLMGSMEPNKARLKTAKEFKKSGFEIPEFGLSGTRAALYAIFELESDVEGDDVLSHLKDMLPNYHVKRDDLAAIADYITRKREAVDETESRAARILHGLIRNERLG